MIDVDLDTDRLNEWIGDRLPGSGLPLTAERMGQGVGTANALFFIRSGADEWVLRRPPVVKNHPTASDTGREWRILNALEGLGKPEGFLARQVSRWLSQLDGYRTRELPEEKFLCEWLEANRPDMSPAAILHGDYSPFNVMVAPDRPVRLAAIVDWDTGTIGDPLLDTGHLLARWTEPGEVSALGGRDAPTANYPTRKEMATRYQDGTGRDLSALAYCEVLALFKLGVILEGNYARARAAGVSDVLNPMGGTASSLFRAAAEFARGERV
jgi:aminoglycoside phosphotransferase (APT) family kinase protein